jgi:hypothetical protein
MGRPRNLKNYEKERVFLLKSWRKTNKDSPRVLGILAEKSPDNPVPTWQASFKLSKHIERRGSVHDFPRGVADFELQ